MVENRWQIAVGALILVAMLMAGAFSVGVYIGRHGLSGQGLRYQPPPANQAPPTGGQAPRPDVLGRLRSVSDQGFELATQSGPRLVAVDDETRLTDAQGQSLAWDDLKQGDLLAVFGDFTAGDGRQLLARRVILVPESP